MCQREFQYDSRSELVGIKIGMPELIQPFTKPFRVSMVAPGALQSINCVGGRSSAFQCASIFDVQAHSHTYPCSQALTHIDAAHSRFGPVRTRAPMQVICA